MSEPKFTKGPWRVGKPFHNTSSRQDVTPIYWDTPPCGECGRSDGEWLVAWTFPNSLKKPQYKFNAHLIAAAPDLYEALNEVETIVSMSVEDDAPSLKKLRSALAKAAGVK